MKTREQIALALVADMSMNELKQASFTYKTLLLALEKKEHTIDDCCNVCNNVGLIVKDEII